MSVTSPTLVHVDPAETPWYDRFFSTWGFDATDDLMEAIDGLTLSVDAVAKSDDLARLGLSGWLYWTLYVKGYLQYVGDGELNADNVHLDYLVRYSRGHNHDPGNDEEFAAQETARARVRLRFRDFDALRRIGRADIDDPTIEPIACCVLREPQIDTKILIDSESGETIAASLIDGYHRIFLARLFGIPRLPCVVTFEADPEGGSDADR